MFFKSFRDERTPFVRLIKPAKGPSSLGIFEKFVKKLRFRNLLFQEDDASMQKAKTVINFFKEEEQEVPKCLANCPDLNAIKN